MLDNILQATFLQFILILIIYYYLLILIFIYININRMSRYTSHKLTKEVCTTTTATIIQWKQNNNNKNTNETYRATNPNLK